MGDGKHGEREVMVQIGWTLNRKAGVWGGSLVDWCLEWRLDGIGV